METDPVQSRYWAYLGRILAGNHTEFMTLGMVLLVDSPANQDRYGVVDDLGLPPDRNNIIAHIVTELKLRDQHDELLDYVLSASLPLRDVLGVLPRLRCRLREHIVRPVHGYLIRRYRELRVLFEQQQQGARARTPPRR